MNETGRAVSVEWRFHQSDCQTAPLIQFKRRRAASGQRPRCYCFCLMQLRRPRANRSTGPRDAFWVRPRRHRPSSCTVAQQCQSPPIICYRGWKGRGGITTRWIFMVIKYHEYGPFAWKLLKTLSCDATLYWRIKCHLCLGSLSCNYITLFTVNGRKNRKNSANSTRNILTIYKHNSLYNSYPQK